MGAKIIQIAETTKKTAQIMGAKIQKRCEMRMKKTKNTYQTIGNTVHKQFQKNTF